MASIRMASMPPMSVPEISAAAERARERLRGEFDQLRVGIEKLQIEEADGDSPLFAISDGAERARERLRGEFDQLRVGIEKLQAKGGR